MCSRFGARVFEMSTSLFGRSDDRNVRTSTDGEEAGFEPGSMLAFRGCTRERFEERQQQQQHTSRAVSALKAVVRK